MNILAGVRLGVRSGKETSLWRVGPQHSSELSSEGVGAHTCRTWSPSGGVQHPHSQGVASVCSEFAHVSSQTQHWCAAQEQKQHNITRFTWETSEKAGLRRLVRKAASASVRTGLVLQTISAVSRSGSAKWK